MQLGSVFTIYCVNTEAVSHTFFWLNQSMSGEDLTTHMIVPNCELSLRRSNLVEAVPRWMKPFVYRFPSGPQLITEARFVSELDRFDAVYLFPDSSTKLMNKSRQSGKPIFVERINCHCGTAKRILDEAYERLGVKPAHNITTETIQRENEYLEGSDFIFCPSPEVKKSLLEFNVSEQKLISTSYGWSPERFPEISLRNAPAHSENKQIIVLFVGTLSLRKGTHLLLKAWEKAGINGKLLLYGRMDPLIATTCARALARTDVIWSEYNQNIGEAYALADIFAFPSLEEGGPLVTYEAMAHSLPVLVSPMGAGAIVRDKVDGIILPPYEEEAWIEALRRLSDCASLRTFLGTSARQRAAAFTWEKVGSLRRDAILKRFRQPPNTSI